MKRIFAFFIALTAFALIGCLDVEEDVKINADGTGIFKHTVDMSGLFDMLAMAAMMDTSANSELKKISDKNVDSIISLKSFTDTSTKLSAEEKRLMQDGTMRMIVNQGEKSFKIIMNYPFKNFTDLQKIIELQESGKGYDPFGKSKENSPMGGEEDMMPSVDFAKMTFQNGLIERKIDQKKLDEMKDNEETKKMEEAGQMLEGITFKTVIHLPKAVTSATGEKVSVSDDKRTVRVSYSLMDVLKSPKALEFKINY